MKNILLIVFTLVLVSCNTESKFLKEPKIEAPITYSLNNAECENHNKRKTVATIENSGVIINIAGNYLIQSTTDNQRYSACNLPEELKKEGVKVQYTGQVKEIYATERLMATFLVLESISNLAENLK